MTHTLLLNGTNEPMKFLNERKLFKFLLNNKVDILETWDHKIHFGKGNIIEYPAVIRLRYHVRWIPRKIKFNRNNVLKRDQLICQYCGNNFPMNKITWDHLFPKSRGGQASWKNCVAACFPCNNKKGNRTPEEARMPLIRKPKAAVLTISDDYIFITNHHESWKNYLP